jgi:transcription-repair coupling factor (superfamily II helicase)
VKALAFDLIKLYAKRKSKPGFAFQPDNYLQHELEASFIYEDTPDQLKATQDVKARHGAPTPMDRLVCGDVGFGKTEVAIRAAFKAVCRWQAGGRARAHHHPRAAALEEFPDRMKGCPCAWITSTASAAAKQQNADPETT